MSYDESSKFPDSPQPDTVVCAWCNTPKPRTEFYARSGLPHLILQGCKECRKAGEKAKTLAGYRRDKMRSETPSEAWVIDRLKTRGIPALPGKALAYIHTDVVAFGCIPIEVKSSAIGRDGSFSFMFTARQFNDRIMGDLIVLVCRYEDRNTYHVFAGDNPIFFNEHGKRKCGVNYRPGTVAATKHLKRNVVTDTMMAEAEDRWSMAWAILKAKSDALKQEAS